MPTVTLGLGTNQGNRIANLRQAIHQLNQCDHIQINKKSAVFQTPALLKPNSPKEWNIDYFNCCISIVTGLSPQTLLSVIKTIELQMGRNLKAERWSPRVIDIDILTWGDQTVNEEDLHIPHIGILERNFVLQPLLQIDPYWKHPNFSELNLHIHLKKFKPLAYAPYQLDTPKLMGILNVSEDSFSGDGLMDINQIEKQFIQLVNQGAEVIDIGAVTTKPNAKKISIEHEWRRLKPVCDRLSLLKSYADLMTIPEISIDTYRPEIVEKLIPYPVDMINDVYGINSKAIANLIKGTTIKYCVMHNCGRAGEEYLDIQTHAIEQLYDYFEMKKSELLSYGLEAKQLIFDVGIGFGKFPFQVKNIFENIHQLQNLGVKLLVGHSRKASISESASLISPTERDFETAVVSRLIQDKVNYLRVHNIEMNWRALLCG